MGKRRVRLHDIAERAGVSAATVSLVLNDKASQGNVRISEETIQRVRRTALSMGYLLRGTVGLIVPWLWSSVEIPLIQGITEVFREAHYNLAMGVMTGRNLDVEIEELRAMDRKGFESVILQPGFEMMAKPDLLRDNFRNWQRAVIINQFPLADFSYVTINQELCGYLATRHLIEMGHQNIACANGRMNVMGADRILGTRAKGYERAMLESGLLPRMLFGEEDALDVPGDVTAIYCSRFRGAANLVGRCIDQGVRVPDDLSIVGTGNDREKWVVRPTITTIDMQAEEMGKQAAEMVLNLMDGKSVENVILEPKLILRDSVQEQT